MDIMQERKENEININRKKGRERQSELRWEKKEEEKKNGERKKKKQIEKNGIERGERKSERKIWG